MRKIHALIYTDYHIRLAKAIAELPETIWYNSPKERQQIVAGEYARQKMKKKYIPLNKEQYFHHMRTSSDIFFTTMRINGDMEHTHPGFRPVKSANLVGNTPLTLLKSRIVLFNEVILYDYKGYVPFGHALLAKSKVEYDFYKEKNIGAEIHLIGHPGLDGAKRTKSNSGDIGVYLCLNRGDACKIADSILRDLLSFVAEATFMGTVFIKDHVSAGAATSGPIMAKIKKTLTNNNIKYSIIDRRKDFYSVADRVSFSFVQSSLSCHFLLRRMGIESFYYTTSANKLENPFIAKSNMPPVTFKDKLEGKYDKIQYDEWLKDMFILDGKSSSRLVLATKGAPYDKT